MSRSHLRASWGMSVCACSHLQACACVCACACAFVQQLACTSCCVSRASAQTWQPGVVHKSSVHANCVEAGKSLRWAGSFVRVSGMVANGFVSRHLCRRLRRVRGERRYWCNPGERTHIPMRVSFAPAGRVQDADGGSGHSTVPAGHESHGARQGCRGHVRDLQPPCKVRTCVSDAHSNPCQACTCARTLARIQCAQPSRSPCAQRARCGGPQACQCSGLVRGVIGIQGCICRMRAA